MTRPALSFGIVLQALLVVALPASGQEPSQRFEPLACQGCSWLKGNTHTHTTESDGDTSPELVARWYRDHGYDFLILSDHNTLTDPGSLAHLVDSGFLLIPGEEVAESDLLETAVRWYIVFIWFTLS